MDIALGVLAVAVGALTLLIWIWREMASRQYLNVVLGVVVILSVVAFLFLREAHYAFYDRSDNMGVITLSVRALDSGHVQGVRSAFEHFNARCQEQVLDEREYLRARIRLRKELESLLVERTGEIGVRH